MAPLTHVRQHIPSCVDGPTPREADVHSLEELLALPWIRRWAEHHVGQPFVGWRRAEHTLMALYGSDEEEWWVVAFVTPGTILEALPVWQISPKGREKVDRWNRGEG